MFKISFLFLSSLVFFACASVSKKEAPVIYFSNISDVEIKDIECNWAGKNKLSLPILSPGDSRSQSFYIRNSADFFGAIVVSWVNVDGEKIEREFFFKENNLPSFSDSTTYNYVQFYLDQDELEIMTSDAPDLAGKTRKMDRLLSQYRQNYAQGHKKVETSLIRVQPQKDNSLPSWLANSY